MNAQEMKELEEIMELFSMPGWKHLQEDLGKAKIAYLQQIHYEIQDGNAYLERRGQLLELDRWISYEDNIRRAYDEASETDSADVN